MKTKITILLFSVFALASCNKPNTVIVDEPITEPDYAKVEFVFDNAAFEGEVEFHISDLQIFNLQESEKYPNGIFSLGEVVKVMPQKFENFTNYEVSIGGPAYTDLDDFDSEGKVFIAIKNWIEILPDHTLHTPNRYAPRSLPVDELKAGVHYRFIIRNDNSFGGLLFIIDDYEILEWED